MYAYKIWVVIGAINTWEHICEGFLIVRDAFIIHHVTIK